VRLGEPNAQSRWVLERAGAPEPEPLAHVFLRARDVMRENFPVAKHDDPVRAVGLAMAIRRTDMIPVVDDDRALVGVITERTLARRYIRESREVSSLVDTPTALGVVVGVLEGELVAGEETEVAGRVWAQSMDVSSSSRIAATGPRLSGSRSSAARPCS
jgi:manganese-dependent inorganic pyrophosphatase